MIDDEANNYDEFAKIVEMTDEQAAEVLQTILNWDISARANGKTAFNLTIKVALHKAIKALRGGENE